MRHYLGMGIIIESGFIMWLSWGRLPELIENDSERLSMRSVLTYAVILTLCRSIFIEMVKTSPNETLVLGLAGILSTLMGTIYGIGKAVDGSVTKAAMPSATPAPVNIPNADSVSVQTNQGDVNVTPKKKAKR